MIQREGLFVFEAPVFFRRNRDASQKTSSAGDRSLCSGVRDAGRHRLCAREPASESPPIPCAAVAEVAPFSLVFFSALQYIGRSINKCVNNRRTLRIKLFLQTREYLCAGTRARRRTRYLYYFNIWLFSSQVNRFFQTLRRLIRDLQ